MCTFLCELGGLEPKCLGLREDCEARSRGGGTGEDAWKRADLGLKEEPGVLTSAEGES